MNLINLNQIQLFFIFLISACDNESLTAGSKGFAISALNPSCFSPLDSFNSILTNGNILILILNTLKKNIARGLNLYFQTPLS